MASAYSMPRPTPPRASWSYSVTPVGPIGPYNVPLGRRVTNCRYGLQLVSAAKSVGTHTDDRKPHKRSGESQRRWQRVARNLGCILVFLMLVWAIRLTRQRFHLPHRSVSRRCRPKTVATSLPPCIDHYHLDSRAYGAVEVTMSPLTTRPSPGGSPRNCCHRTW
jgi:hypothetical protein